MNISLDWKSYLEHKEFFDAMAHSMQASMQHRVGIIASMREKDPVTEKDLKKEITEQIGFTPQFIRLWGYNETIANASLWKAERIHEEDVWVHFDIEAREIKKYTDRWVIKIMSSAQKDKF